MPKRILIHGDETLGRERFKGQDVELFGNEVTPPDMNGYDVVVLSNLVQQLNRVQVPGVVRLYRDALKEGGTLIVTAPSLEWACTELAAKDDASLFTYVALYGDGEVQHLSGYKLLWLRMIVERAGLLVERAHAEEYRITTEDGDEHRVLQNVVIATKRVMDAAEAIP